MRRSAVVAVTVLALALVFAGVVIVFTTPTTESAPNLNDEDDLFRFEGYESGVWTYLSTSESFQKQSPINVIVRADADAVIESLRTRGDTTWNTTAEQQRHHGPDETVPKEVNLTGTDVDWGDTDGAKRYAYVHDGDNGSWVEETEQLHNGDYFGDRTHIRLYESPRPDEPWVAMQVHTEHFDWFTLRHAVDGVEAGQRQVETEFMYMTNNSSDVRRVYLANDARSDADGWATVVELAIALPGLLVGMVSMRSIWRNRLTSADRARARAIRDRISIQHGLLIASIIGLVLGVRAAGIWLEWYADSLSMHAISALLYPVIAIGIPVATYAFAHRLKRRMDAAVTASGALAIAFLLDYAYVGVYVLPIRVVLRRTGIIVALGLIAGGAAKRATRERRFNRLLVGGVVLWLSTLGVTLFQLI